MNSAVFRNLVSPSVPGDLRARVLAACRLADAGERRHWIDRIWESPQLRLAWALTMLVLLFSSIASERSAQVASPRFAPVASAGVEGLGLAEAELFGSARSQTTLMLASMHWLPSSDLEELAP